MTHAERENLIFKHRVLSLLEIKSIYAFSSQLNEIKKKNVFCFDFILLFEVSYCIYLNDALITQHLSQGDVCGLGIAGAHSVWNK